MRKVEEAYEQRDPLTVYVRCEPSFDALRELPEFQALVGTIGVGGSAGA